jgi:hypothetical protein
MEISGSKSEYNCSIIDSIPLNVERRITNAAVITVIPPMAIRVIQVITVFLPFDLRYRFAM